MVKEELLARSPVRVFEKFTGGELAAGEIGVISAPSGLGKTSVLVQIALDKLLMGKKVIHVSFTQHADYVLGWYDAIFGELIGKKPLDGADDVRDDIVKNRVLMNFNQDAIRIDMILNSIKAMITDGGFKAEKLIIDGLDFSRIDADRLSAVKTFAGENGLGVWYSCTVKGPPPLYDKHGIPNVIAAFADAIDVVICLEPRPDHVKLTVTKERGGAKPAAASKELKLDPKTLLMKE
jgi:hypothetical protein